MGIQWESILGPLGAKVKIDNAKGVLGENKNSDLPLCLINFNEWEITINEWRPVDQKELQGGEEFHPQLQDQVVVETTCFVQHNI